VSNLYGREGGGGGGAPKTGQMGACCCRGAKYPRLEPSLARRAPYWTRGVLEGLTQQARGRRRRRTPRSLHGRNTSMALQTPRVSGRRSGSA
jgi:hypothetical protein